MTVSSLTDYSSLVREIGGSVPSSESQGNYWYRVPNQERLLGFDSGKEMWRSRFEGPCSNADSNKDFLFFTESDRVHAIMLSSGDEAWCVELGVRAILLSFIRMRLGDFVSLQLRDSGLFRGSVWKIDYSGKVRWRGDTIGRAWSLSDFQGQAIMGLSRPKCGYAIASEKGIEYHELEENKPITAGCKLDGGGIVFGHSNGSVTDIWGSLLYG